MTISYLVLTTFANSSNFNCTTTHCQNMYVPQTTPQQCHNFLNICHIHIYIIYIMYQVDLNLLVGVMTFTFSPLHCFYATIVEGGAADRRRRPILVCTTYLVSARLIDFFSKARSYRRFLPPDFLVFWSLSQDTVPLSNRSRSKKKSAIHFGSCIFLYIWFLRDPTFPAKKKQNNNR